jgi:hypothetical protein
MLPSNRVRWFPSAPHFSKQCQFSVKIVRPTLLRVILSVCLMCVPIVVSGQVQSPALPPKQPANWLNNTLTLFGTTSIANASLYGSSFDRRLSMFGVRYNRTLFRTGWFALNYTPEVVPVAILSQPAIGDFAVSRKNLFTRTQFSYAAGMNPLGAELVFLPRRRIQPFIGTNDGFIYFSRNGPSAFAAQFNFSLAAGGGIKVKLRDGNGIDFGYLFHHCSIDFQAQENPGLDSHMLRFGYTFAFHRSPA